MEAVAGARGLLRSRIKLEMVEVNRNSEVETSTHMCQDLYARNHIRTTMNFCIAFHSKYCISVLYFSII
jgi:hypothetical protein